ncbi:hypothetical protein H310_12059 [Aphanomyces invadans]|uniref:Uncharacterized protein n=1 Tax=Aphanomyces invadans TaxID=157072 RepID=A0A024TJ51_9STRA|nr:hypothetical protein H310_12059 [Aphanomyces invadans]ETV94004.1 hypothetical protein H310_12059 [Aphanomyces invadans]|eukprot:XP_008877207.1 hypothetical protein H310_12059 [Aphanomyces invadans]
MLHWSTVFTFVSRSTSSRYMCIFFSAIWRHFLSRSKSFSRSQIRCSSVSSTARPSMSNGGGSGERKRSTTWPDDRLRRASTTSSNLYDVMSSSLMRSSTSPGLIIPQASPGADRPDGNL